VLLGGVEGSVDAAPQAVTTTQIFDARPYLVEMLRDSYSSIVEVFEVTCLALGVDTY